MKVNRFGFSDVLYNHRFDLVASKIAIHGNSYCDVLCLRALTLCTLVYTEKLPGQIVLNKYKFDTKYEPIINTMPN